MKRSGPLLVAITLFAASSANALAQLAPLTGGQMTPLGGDAASTPALPAPSGGGWVPFDGNQLVVQRNPDAVETGKILDELAILLEQESGRPGIKSTDQNTLATDLATLSETRLFLTRLEEQAAFAAAPDADTAKNVFAELHGLATDFQDRTKGVKGLGDLLGRLGGQNGLGNIFGQSMRGITSALQNNDWRGALSSIRRVFAGMQQRRAARRTARAAQQPTPPTQPAPPPTPQPTVIEPPPRSDTVSADPTTTSPYDIRDAVVELPPDEPGIGAGDTVTFSDVWKRATKKTETGCGAGCTKMDPIHRQHGGAIVLNIDEDADGPLHQWVDCLQTIKTCIVEGKGDAGACVGASSCPQPCKDKFASKAGGKKDLAAGLDQITRQFLGDDAMCSPQVKEGSG
ncbi:MAG: hypothetical protein ISR44_11040 [Rhodospirillales bacterium]|nr:hypothetical protein [Rhodospirillales bacterium]